jgi:plastocyanin
MNKTLIPALAVLALAATACSGGAAEPAAEAAQAAAASQTVSMADLAYSPAQLEVPAGTTVTWTNDDEAPHTVTFDGDAIADSDQLEPGADFSATFDKAGTYTYICAIHPDMKGTVTVA